jgi:hypothetical protein
MKKTSPLWTTLLLLCSFFAGTIPANADNKKEGKKSDQKKDQKNQDEVSSDDREELNYGYAIMYQHINDISGVKFLMAVKKNSEGLGNLTDKISKTLEQNKKTLDELKKTYPAIDFENRGQPDVYEKVVKAIKWHKTKAYLPVVGMSGQEFERDFVIDTKYGIDQITRISGELSEREKNEGLKKALHEISEQNKQLIKDMNYLLNQKYYKVNLNKKK